MRVVELEMPFVIKLEQGWAVRVLLLQVDVVNLGLLGRVATVLTHVNLARGEKLIKCQDFFIQTLTLDLRCL